MMTEGDGIPHYRIDIGKGLTLAWDVMIYGQPNEENVRKFLKKFRGKMEEKRLPMERGTKKIVDQNTGETIVEINDDSEELEPQS